MTRLNHAATTVAARSVSHVYALGRPGFDRNHPKKRIHTIIKTDNFMPSEQPFFYCNGQHFFFRTAAYRCWVSGAGFRPP